MGIASDTGHQRLRQPSKPLTAHGRTSLFSITTSSRSPEARQLYQDRWMDGRKEGRKDGGSSIFSIRVLKLSNLTSPFTMRLLLY